MSGIVSVTVGVDADTSVYMSAATGIPVVSVGGTYLVLRDLAACDNLLRATALARQAFAPAHDEDCSECHNGRVVQVSSDGGDGRPSVACDRGCGWTS